MKKVLLLSFLAFGSFAVSAQSKSKKTTATGKAPAISVAEAKSAPEQVEEATKGTTIEFEKTVYEFGSIPQGTPVDAEFVFTNTGKEPLILQKVTASCGCTTPYYTQKPVAPGEKGMIKATYNAAAAGPFTKPVTVIYNGGQMQLSLKGTVERAPESSVPANKASILKK